MPDYIFDATVLSDFAAAGRLDLLEERYRGAAYTTIEVGNELRKGIKAGQEHLQPAVQQIESVNPDGWLRIIAPELPEEHHLRMELDRSLDAGEASCLALAVSRGLVLVADELAARRLAAKQEVRLTGTLGILIALVRDGRLAL